MFPLVLSKNPAVSNIALSEQYIQIWSFYLPRPTCPFPVQHQLLSILSPEETSSPSTSLHVQRNHLFKLPSSLISTIAYLPCVASMISPHCSQIVQN